MFEDDAPLTPAGIDRREQILRAARSEARRVRRNRQTRRVAATGLLVVVCVITALRFGPGNTPPSPIAVISKPATMASVIPVPAPPAPVPAPPRHLPHTVVVTFIQTDPDLSKKLAMPRQRPTWRRLNDDELLQQLANAGRPAGLAWVDGRELLLFQDTASQPARTHNAGVR